MEKRHEQELNHASDRVLFAGLFGFTATIVAAFVVIFYLGTASGKIPLLPADLSYLYLIGAAVACATPFIAAKFPKWSVIWRHKWERQRLRM